MLSHASQIASIEKKENYTMHYRDRRTLSQIEVKVCRITAVDIMGLSRKHGGESVLFKVENRTLKIIPCLLGLRYFQHCSYYLNWTTELNKMFVGLNTSRAMKDSAECQSGVRTCAETAS